MACKLGREVLDAAAAAVDVGVTTDEIDRVVHEETVDRDCYPSPLNYYEVGGRPQDWGFGGRYDLTSRIIHHHISVAI